MFKDIISKPLHEVVDRTLVLASKDKPASVVHPVYHMVVYRDLKDSRANGNIRHAPWATTPTFSQRLWCAFDTCNGCYGERQGKLWMFGFTTRADGRAFRAHLARKQCCKQNVVTLSPLFSLWLQK